MKFVFSEAFSHISSPEALRLLPKIGGCCHQGHNTYRISGGKPMLIERREIRVIWNDTGKERSLFTLSRRVNGKMRRVKRGYRHNYDYGHRLDCSATDEAALL